jgi:hypothetical protein
MTYGPKPRPVAERFWALVDRSGECWEWRGGRYLNGYGRFRLNNPRRMTGAHRVAYELTHGPVPDGLLVLHGCDNRACCRPDHLRVGTAGDNIRDALSRGRVKVGPDHHIHHRVVRRFPGGWFARTQETAIPEEETP